jgi:biotin carboxylase
MRVLVVGTNRMCHERLRDQGHELVLFVPRGRARPGDPAGPYRHVVILDDAADPRLWTATARVLHAAAPFDAVTAFNEHTYPIVAAVAEELGVPTTIDVELYERVLDKSRVRDALDRHGIPNCRHRTASGRAEVQAEIDEIGTPCVVKPVDGEASAGVARIDAPGDVEAALARVGAEHLARRVIVEEFLAGEELSVEGVSSGGRHRILAVTKKYVDPGTFVERGHLVPAPLAPAARDAAVRYVERVLDALGFHDCPSHTEIVLTAEGPRLIETHNRVGGDNIMDLVELATGIDVYGLVARQSVGEDPFALLPAPAEPHRSAAAWYAAPAGPSSNVLLDVGGLDAARALPDVARVELLKPPGTRQGPVAQSADRSGYALAVGPTPAAALARAREAVATLDFRYGRRPEPL